MVIWLGLHWLQLAVLAGIAMVVILLLGIDASLTAAAHSARSLNEEIRRSRATVGEIVDNLRQVNHGLSQLALDVDLKLSDAVACVTQIQNDVAEVLDLLTLGRQQRLDRLEIESDRRRVELEQRFQKLRTEAEAGNLNSAIFYAQYLEIERNYVQSYMWLSIVTKRAAFPEHASKRRQELAFKMTPDQISEAEEAADQWLQAHADLFK